jgi:carbon storage regulator
MLVLARRIGEEIVIDGHIVIKILDARGATVRLGVSAPSGVPVDRREVHDRRIRERAAELRAAAEEEEVAVGAQSAPVS